MIMASQHFKIDAVDSSPTVVDTGLPLKHETLFAEFRKRGFHIELMAGENPLEVIISFLEYIRTQNEDNTDNVANILRNSGHSHLIIYLYNEEVQIQNIDITDVCKYFPEIPVNVNPSSEFVQPSEMIYKMTSYPRGLALVINNRKFSYKNSKEIRYGSERDFKYWTTLFFKLGYKVFADENLTGEKMSNSIKTFAGLADHENTDSCIVAISTHGSDKNWIQGVDGVGLDVDEDIFAHFNNVNCPNLKGKPKLFFIQACRGCERDRGTDDAIDSKPIMDDTIDRHPSWSDIAIIQSTIPGYVSNRSQCEGSWFVQAIVKVFMEHSCNTDLETMLKMVTRKVMRFQTFEQEMQAPEITYRGWTKSLFFNPS